MKSSVNSSAIVLLFITIIIFLAAFKESNIRHQPYPKTDAIKDSNKIFHETKIITPLFAVKGCHTSADSSAIDSEDVEPVNQGRFLTIPIGMATLQNNNDTESF